MFTSPKKNRSSVTVVGGSAFRMGIVCASSISNRGITVPKVESVVYAPIAIRSNRNGIAGMS